MAGLDKDYIRQHLLDYARYQIKQGYMPDDLRKVFHKMGYHKAMIDSVLGDIDPAEIPPKKEPHDPGKMDESIKLYVENMLIDFIMKERKLGYEDAAIRRALQKFGHHPKMIDQAWHAINKGDAVDYGSVPVIQINAQILLAVSMLIFFTFSVFLSISTNVSITVVLISLAPSAAAVLAIYFICFFVTSYRQLLPLLGLALALGGYMILAHLSPTVQRLPGASIILGLNLVTAFILSAIFAFFAKHSEEEIIEKAHSRKKTELLYTSQVPEKKAIEKTIIDKKTG